MRTIVKKLVPRPIFTLLQPYYHFALALLGAIIYGFPSRKIRVIGITGTKGKTSTAEFVNAILLANGENTAVLGTLRFKIGEKNERNMYKMTMPGRFFVQKFLSDAVEAGCTYAVIEMTSEGAKQFRQRFVDMDALIFTNLSPEHIESHGSYDNYVRAKLDIAHTLARSKKQHRYMVANTDDKETTKFFSIKGVEQVGFSLQEAGQPTFDEKNGTTFEWSGERMSIHLPGKFSLYNALAAACCASILGVPNSAIAAGLNSVRVIPGRAEEINNGQLFKVVVDYAHTPDSLTAIYEAYPGVRICVLGNTGGGRDKWKRPVMGEIADTYCDQIILTNEDPYDEDPEQIINEVASGIKQKNPAKIMDRRAAINEALNIANALPAPEKATVIISGKGTDPYIMGANGTKIPWDDRTVAQEEIKKVIAQQSNSR